MAHRTRGIPFSLTSLRAVGVFLVVAAIIVLGCVFMFQPPVGNAEPESQRKESEFAVDRARVPFDGTRAMKDLEALCEIGPRISGSEGMKKQQEMLEKHFKDLGATVTYQRFEALQVSRKSKVPMANMIISWHPESKRRVLFCCHYDTRPLADQEPNRRDWNKPFVSANDGTSSVALFMELGRHMKDLKTKVGIDFVFFDGEEYIFEPNSDKYFFGSEHFATDYRKNKPEHKYFAAILLDLVGGKNARFPAEGHSYFLQAALVEDVWQVAEEQKCTAFVKDLGQAVEDDHLALNRIAGIPAIDIIDFNYRHWHRLSDVPANCSSDSLDQVARVLIAWVAKLK